MNERKKPVKALVSTKTDPDDGLTQSERFIKAAQELGTNDDPERFAETVKKLAKHPLKSLPAETPHQSTRRKS